MKSLKICSTLYDVINSKFFLEFHSNVYTIQSELFLKNIVNANLYAELKTKLYSKLYWNLDSEIDNLINE